MNPGSLNKYQNKLIEPCTHKFISTQPRQNIDPTQKFIRNEHTLLLQNPNPKRKKQAARTHRGTRRVGALALSRRRPVGWARCCSEWRGRPRCRTPPWRRWPCPRPSTRAGSSPAAPTRARTSESTARSPWRVPQPTKTAAAAATARPRHRAAPSSPPRPPPGNSSRDPPPAFGIRVRTCDLEGIWEHTHAPQPEKPLAPPPPSPPRLAGEQTGEKGKQLMK